MILELLLYPIFALIDFLISLLPTMPNLDTSWVLDFHNILASVFFFIPADIWKSYLDCFIFWAFALIAYAVIEWIWKKIPGED